MTIADEVLDLAELPELAISAREIQRARWLRLDRAREADLADPVITRVERQAAAHDRPAVRDALRALSYAELADEARRTATLLERAGVAPGAVVAVGGARGARVISAFLALELLGAVYVPVDANWPAQRVADVLGQAKAALLLDTGTGTDRHRHRLRPLPSSREPRRRESGSSAPPRPTAANRGRAPPAWRASTSPGTCSSPRAPPASPRARWSSTWACSTTCGPRSSTSA